MKILKLNIDSYKHLEKLEFDFTYQSGERKGQTLDKICFIGQSASGKTSLLELIYDFIKDAFNLEVIERKHLSPMFRRDVVNFDGEIELSINNNSFALKNNVFLYKNKSYKTENASGSVTPLIPLNERKEYIYFKASLVSDKNIEIFANNPVDLFEKYSELTSINLNNLLNPRRYPNLFHDEVDPKMWILLLKEILEYRKKFNQKMSELIHKGLLANPKKLSAEFEKWQKENPNKLEAFAEKFNPILEKLNLEVDIVDTEYSIPIKNKKNEEIIPIQNTSTGTKGLLLSFLPLYKLDTTGSIILIDEPERSLYPDMQMDLMEHYKKFAPDAQFIVATHSPFIAAAFEPDERFILYFDKNGKVAVRRGSSPIGDDPNDMLKNDFGVNYYNKHGEEAYKKYLELKQLMANETNPDKKKELLLETVKLGDTYNF